MILISLFTKIEAYSSVRFLADVVELDVNNKIGCLFEDINVG